ncbi:hypothetical protein PFISCL1PPCAC_1018, partial [Pristionchus fissidentatus]
MSGWPEVIPDIVLASLYSVLLIRIITSPDSYFRTPFFTFFIITGVYNILAVVTYHVVVQFPYTENNPTVYIFKACFAANTLGAIASTIGKVYISIHRFFVLRTRDFSERVIQPTYFKNSPSSPTICALLSIVPIWPAGYQTVQVNGQDIITALSYNATLTMKIISVSFYLLYIVVNGVFTVLASRELVNMQRIMKGDAVTSRSLFLHQRNMFIIVLACSLSHLLKAAQQV